MSIEKSYRFNGMGAISAASGNRYAPDSSGYITTSKEREQVELDALCDGEILVSAEREAILTLSVEEQISIANKVATDAVDAEVARVVAKQKAINDAIIANDELRKLNAIQAANDAAAAANNVLAMAAAADTTAKLIMASEAALTANAVAATATAAADSVSKLASLKATAVAKAADDAAIASASKAINSVSNSTAK